MANPPIGGSIRCYEFDSHMNRILPGSVMVNTSDFDSDILSSSLSLVTNMLALAYLVKHPSVQRKNRVLPIAIGMHDSINFLLMNTIRR